MESSKELRFREGILTFALSAKSSLGDRRLNINQKKECDERIQEAS